MRDVGDGRDPRDVLVVGAGAIGRVVAHHLARGGAAVSTLVKPAHAAATARGFTVARRRRTGVDPVRRVGFADVLVDLDGVAAAPWDAIVLCVPSPALADRAWLAGLAAATGDATVVAFQPGLDDPARVEAAFGAGRTVIGALGLMAWAGDGPADTDYWLPPLAGIPLTGPRDRAEAVAALLARGGLPARRHDDAASVAGLGAAVLEATAAGLACAGWRRDRLGRDRALAGVTARAARQAMAVVAASRGRRAPAASRWFGPRALHAMLWGLARIAPLDVDQFFARHYGKLALQSDGALAAWSARAAELGLAADALDQLRAARREVDRAA